MTEGCSNGLNGDAVEHLVTNCFLDAISHTAAGKCRSNRSLNVQSMNPNESVCAFTHKVRRSNGRG